MLILMEVEIHNFKTYLRSNTIKFIGKLNVVTGPNGTGKSNFMDAVAFAMGAKATDLRVSRLRDLFHSSASKSTTLYVKLILSSADGDERCFQRSMRGSNCQYRINDNEVSFGDYEDELKKLNIHIRIKNFLVFQESIESFLMKKPRERTMDFEEMSNSVAFKAEYDRLKEQLLKYETEHQSLTRDKRTLVKEMRDMQMFQLEIKKYTKLLKQNEESRLLLLLFNLYHTKQTIDSLIQDEKKLKEAMEELAKEKYGKEKKLRRMLDYYESVTDQLTEREEACKPKEIEVKKLSDKMSEIRAKKDHFRKRISTCEESYESAKKADQARRTNIRDLEDTLKKVEREKDTYVRQYINTLGRDVQLSTSKLKEYEKLKLCVDASCADDNNQLLILGREYNAFKDIYDNENTKLNEAEILVNRSSMQRDIITARVEKWEDSVQKAQSNLEMKGVLYNELKTKLECSKQEEEMLKCEINKIEKELEGFEEDEFQSIRKKREIVQKLRGQFPGVYKRLSDLCQPIHDRYNIAVTKVLGVHADSIVVDKAKTARDCIEYLKENRIGTRTFLPLDQLRECRLSDQLRCIRDPPNVKLIYDVISFEPSEIAKAVFFATGNTLVCDTPEHASRVAYQMGRRNDCVSIDGCYYRKSGIISGGNQDLARKAKIWNLQKRESLKETKEILMTKLRQTMKVASNQSDLSLLAVEMKNIEMHLKYLTSDRTQAYKELSQIDNELKALVEKREAAAVNVAKAKYNMDQAFEKMNTLKLKCDAKKTEIFANFCRSIGVDNIDDFENGKNLYENKVREFDQLINRIKEQLTYEGNGDTRNNVERWGKNLIKLNNELESILEREIDVESLLDEATNELSLLQNECRDASESVKKTQKDILQLREEISELAKKHVSLTNSLNQIQHTMNKNKAYFHTLLNEAKLNGFAIVARDGQTSSTSQTSESSSENTKIDSLSETYEVEAKVDINFSKLPEEFRILDDTEIRKIRENLEQDIAEQWKEIDARTNPDIRVSQHLTLMEEKLAEINRKLEENRSIIRSTSHDFDVVKKQRYNQFMEFYNHVSNRVDVIYKKLMRNPAAQAYLMADNPEEPYLGGIQYDCVVPNKRFQTNENLSGGEKAMASLPLLFAMQSIGDTQPPFDIFDEIDAPLDRSNAVKVVNYIREYKDNQSIIISHKKEFLAGANSIIGITSTGLGSTLQSQIFTFNLNRYAERMTRKSLRQR